MNREKFLGSLQPEMERNRSGTGQVPSSGTVCLRPHEAPLPRALEKPSPFAWTRPQRHRQGTLAKSAQGGSSQDWDPSPAGCLTWASILNPATPPSRAPHLLNAGGGQLGSPWAPSTDNRPSQAVRRGSCLAGGPRDCSGVPGLGVTHLSLDKRPHPSPLHKAPQSSGVGGDIIFLWIL